MTINPDLSPRWIVTKAILFFILGLVSTLLIWLETVSPRIMVMMMIAIWSFCRFYYFLFYVIEKYVNSEFRYNGLTALISAYVFKKNHNGD